MMGCVFPGRCPGLACERAFGPQIFGRVDAADSTTATTPSTFGPQVFGLLDAAVTLSSSRTDA